MVKDLIDRVRIVGQAVVRWQGICEAVAHDLAKEGVEPEDLPDEQVVMLGDGRAMVFVDYQGERLASMILESDEWTFYEKH